MESTSEGYAYERPQAAPDITILPPDALESLCGVTPHTCRHCREHFAFDFSHQELGEKSTENLNRFEPDLSLFDNAADYTFLNVAYEELAEGAKMDCPLCAQWMKYAAEHNIIAYRFGSGFQGSELHMYTSLSESEKLVYRVTVPPESPFARDTFGRPFNHTPGSSSSLSKARHWLQNCRHLHDLCHPLILLSRPRLLVHISKTPAGYSLKLVEGRDLLSPDYAALSYCWGDDQDSLAKTTIATLQEYRTGIDFHALPKTIQDAVIVTSALRLSYVWCDSLCIVQDDERQKGKEISSMGDIYAGAIVTIAASRAERAQDGFLGPRVIPGWNSSTVVSLPCRTTSGKSGSLTLSPQFDKLPEPLDARAWALQEQALSGRVLSFGRYETRWICKQSEESDILFGEPEDPDENAETIWRRRAYVRDRGEESRISHYITGQQQHLAKVNPRAASLYNFMDEEDELPDIPTEAHEEWQKLVTEYTCRKLTNTEDRLPAIAGIASKCQTLLDCRYYAGLWETHIVKELLWKGSGSVLPRPSRYQAPSWSWASIHSPVTFWRSAWHGVDHKDFRVVDCKISNARQESPFGSVLDGYIELAGRTRLANLYTAKSWRSHQRIFHAHISHGGETKRLQARIWCDAVEPETPDGATDAMAVTLFLVRGSQDNEWHNVLSVESFQGLCLKQLLDGRYQRVGVFETTSAVEESRTTIAELLEGLSIDKLRICFEHNLWLSTGDIQTIAIV